MCKYTKKYNMCKYVNHSLKSISFWNFFKYDKNALSCLEIKLLPIRHFPGGFLSS